MWEWLFCSTWWKSKAFWICFPKKEREVIRVLAVTKVRKLQFFRKFWTVLANNEGEQQKCSCNRWSAVGSDLYYFTKAWSTSSFVPPQTLMKECVRIWAATRGNMVSRNSWNILALICSLHPSDLTNFSVVIPHTESANRGQNATLVCFNVAFLFNSQILFFRGMHVHWWSMGLS